MRAYYASSEDPPERRPGRQSRAVAPVAGRAISSIREKIARRMRESLATTAQYTLNASADAGGLLTLRARVKASKGVPDININDLVTFCTIQALQQIPDLNAEFIDGKIQQALGDSHRIRMRYAARPDGAGRTRRAHPHDRRTRGQDEGTDGASSHRATISPTTCRARRSPSAISAAWASNRSRRC